ncbi:hypothetical protein Tco_0767139 [Tanacetum coccineum]
MLGLARLRRTPSACLCFWAYPSIGPGPDGLDPTRKKTSLMLSERRLGASLLKGNFHHWRPLFLHFDTYFKSYLSCRKDHLIADTLEDDAPFPKQSVLQILRVMQIIWRIVTTKVPLTV